jgi:hypothetical protein
MRLSTRCGGVRHLLLGLLCSLFFACGSSSSNDGTLIPETTKVLSAADLKQLSLPNGDLGVLEFPSASGAVAKLSVGDVVVAGVVDGKLPYGMLRKITAVESSGSLRLTTVEATLTEAIERGSLSQQVTLAAQGISKTSSPLTLDGIGRKRIAVESTDKGFVFALNDVTLYDLDGDSSTKADRVSLDGNFSFAPTFSIVIDIDKFSLKTLKLELGSDQQAAIRVTAGREATFSEVRTLETIELTPITFSIGPVPVVIVPRIALRMGVNGKVTAELTTGVNGEANVKIGFGYENGSWGASAEINPTAQLDAPTFRDGAKGSAKVWAGPRLELAAYGVAGVFGELRGYIEGEVDSTANPWWTLSAGVEALAGAFLKVFSKTIADHETKLFGKKVGLADAGGPAPLGGKNIITWARAYGGDNTDQAVSLIATNDGGSLLVGASNSFSSSSADMLLVKLDRLGNISWQRAFDGLPPAVAATTHPQGGFVIFSATVGTGADTVVVMRVDENGDPTWTKRYAASEDLSIGGAVRIDKTYYVGGSVGAGTNADFWLAAFDDQGKPLWSKRYAGDKDDLIDGLIATSDGGLVAVGPTHSFAAKFNDSWLIKVDNSGKLLWQQSFDSGSNDMFSAIVEDAQGNLFVAGHDFNDAVVLKLSATGKLLLAKRHTTGTKYDNAYHAVAAKNGGLLLSGKTGLGDKTDLWLLRLTPQLEALWSTSYGGSKRDSAGGTNQYAETGSGLAKTADGGFIALANSNSFGDDFSDIWVVKVSESGAIGLDSGGGATQTTLGGSFEDVTMTVKPSSVAATDVSLTIEDLEPKDVTPSLWVKTQGSP